MTPIARMGVIKTRLLAMTRIDTTHPKRMARKTRITTCVDCSGPGSTDESKGSIMICEIAHERAPILIWGPVGPRINDREVKSIHLVCTGGARRGEPKKICTGTSRNPCPIYRSIA